jgi:Family of unknown function (DUF6084)
VIVGPAMAELVFDCVDVRPDPYAAGPTLNFRLRVAETTGERVHALALRCQVRIEPHKRRYLPAEAERLNDLFGDTSRWAQTLKPLQFANVSVMVPSFTGSAEVDMAVPCTYDLEIASTGYFHALEEGEIPFLLLFSGTVFTKGENGFSVMQVPWHKEASYRLPVSAWRLMMDRFFPGGGWLRLSRSALEALGAFKNARALATWEETITVLLDEASQRTDLAP